MFQQEVQHRATMLPLLDAEGELKTGLPLSCPLCTLDLQRVFLSLKIYNHPSSPPSVPLSMLLSVRLSTRPSVHLFIHPCIHLSMQPFTHRASDSFIQQIFIYGVLTMASLCWAEPSLGRG